MKYPTVNKKPLSPPSRRFFRVWKRIFRQQIAFDNAENKLGLRRRDIDLLAWNCATRIVASFERKGQAFGRRWNEQFGEK